MKINVVELCHTPDCHGRVDEGHEFCFDCEVEQDQLYQMERCDIGYCPDPYEVFVYFEPKF